jgi:hypothetical protein
MRSEPAAGPWCMIGASGDCQKVELEIDCCRRRVVRALAPMASLTDGARMEAHEGTQISANACQHIWTRKAAASLRVVAVIGCINLKQQDLRRDPTRQAPSATLHTMHKPALNNEGLAMHDQGVPGRVKDSCAAKPKSWRPTTVVVPEPPATYNI